MEEIGSCVGMGNTLKEACSQAKKIAASIKGYGVNINCDCLDQANDEINKLSKVGIKIF
jgi:hypothetical protein